jgi:flagellin
MSLRINTNVSALNTHRALKANDLDLSKSLERMSSGLRINRASDDAASLSISETLRAQVRGSSQAMKNTQDGINLLNTAEGALAEIASILQRIRELSIQSANGTLTSSDRMACYEEAHALTFEVDNITSYTSYNGIKLLDGSLDPNAPLVVGSLMTLQVGANSGQELSFAILDSTPLTINIADDINNDNLFTDNGVDTTPDLTTQVLAESWIGWIDPIISRISQTRASIGTLTNRLEHTLTNLAAGNESQAAAESRIRDVDVADQMSTLTRQQIMTQSATAMLAQANSQPSTLLSLFEG